MRRRTISLWIVLITVSMTAHALPPFSSLRNIWYAGDAAKKRGFPERIEISAFGKALVDARACTWIDKKGEVEVGINSWSTYVVTVSCDGMVPFNVFLDLSIEPNKPISDSTDTALVDFGERDINQDNPNCSNMLKPCAYPHFEWYFTKEGMERQKTTAPQLKEWGRR